MQDFPLVARDNPWLSCFNCYQDHYEFSFFESGNAPKRGKYYMACDTCGYRTFFDFIGDKNAANIDRCPK